MTVSHCLIVAAAGDIHKAQNYTAEFDCELPATCREFP